VTAAPEERALPSGDVIVTFRLSVPRRPTPMSRGSKQTADWVDCVAFAARCRRSVAAWTVGDEVLVEGALRRRFYRSAGGAGTRLEVEVLSARRTVRAP
jgi:single-strand DNA-binding protein